MTTFPDRDTFAGIRRFQDDHGLRVDGVMEPGGPTERSLNAELNPWYAPDDRATGVMEPGGAMESPMGAGYDPGNATGDRTADMQIAQQGPAEQDLRYWQLRKFLEVAEKIGSIRESYASPCYGGGEAGSVIGAGGEADEVCQRRSKISPPGRSKTSPLNVMRYAVLGGCPGSP